MAGTAAAQGSVTEIVDNGEPADVPTQDSDVTQNLTQSGNVSFNTSEANTVVAVEWDISGTPIVDAINSDTTVNITKTDGDPFNGIKGASAEDGIVYFTAEADGTGAQASNTFLNATVELEGLDTTGLETETDLEYTLSASTANEDTFSRDPINQVDRATGTDPFNLAFVEVVDESDGDTDVVTDIGSAFDQSILDDIDLDQETTINVGAGTYTPDNVDIVNDSITVQPAGDGEVEFKASSDLTGEMFNVSTADGITFQNVAFDFNKVSGVTAALNVSTEAGEVTVDGATFRSSQGNSQDAIRVSNQSETVTVTGSTFDARPDTEDTVTTDTAINITDFGSSAGSGSLSLTVEQSTFDGYGNGTVGNLTAGVGSQEPAVDSVTINSNSFANGNIYFNKIGGGSTTDLDSAFSNNEFSQYVVERNADGDIQEAVYGDLATAQTTGNIGSLGQDFSLEVTGEHSGVSTVTVQGNGTTVTSPDGSADIEVADGTDEFVDIDVSTTQSAITDVTISDLSVTAATDGSESFVINDTNPGTYIDDLIIENNEFVLEGSNTYGVLINSTDLQNTEFVDNQFVRNDDATAYGGAINTEDVDFVDTGDQTTVDIAENEVLGAASGINVSTNENTDNNLDVSVDDNTVQLAESASTGVNLTVDDANDVSVTNNNFISMDDDEVEQFGTDGTALNLTVTAPGEASVVTVEANEFTDIANESLTTGAARHFAGTAISLGGAADGGSSSAVSLSDNDLQNSDIHIDITQSGFDQSDILGLINSNTVQPDIRILDDTESDDNTARDDGESIAHAASYGTITAGVIDSVGANSEAVNVGPGTYSETQIDVSNGIFVESTAGPEETTLTTDTDEYFFDLDNNPEVSGFTFAPTADDDQADILISGGNPNVVNNVFDGPDGENRRAIAVNDMGGTVEITDSTISGYAEGIDVNDDADNDLVVVRNTITNNELGVSLSSGAGGGADASINFNDIAGNDVGLEADDPDYNNINATAVWWGDQSGPSGDDAPQANEGLGNEVIDDFGDGMNITPWLDDSISTLPESGYVVVTDERDRIGSENTKETADIVVATLDDTEATNEAADSTVVTADPSGPISVSSEFNQDKVSAANPATYSATASETGEYTITARHIDGAVAQGDAVQTFVGDAADVDVTVDSDTLIANEQSTVNATLQVVDSEGNAVNLQGETVQWLVDNSSNANITRESVETETDVNGQASLTLSAATAGFDIEVTGVESSNTGASDTATFETVEPAASDFQLELIEGPTQIVQNESYSATVEVTNNGTGTGTQDISYVLEDSAGLSSGIEAVEEGVELEPGESQQVTFDVAAADTDALETGTFTHVFESADDEISLDAEVVAEQTASASVTFNDQTVQSGNETVTVDSADYTLANGTAGDYVVVAHVVSDEFDNGLSAPVGYSPADLSNGEEDITINLNDSDAAFEDDDALDTLSENVTLRAMLHTTDNDSAFGTRLGNAIDGIEPGDETDDADITVTPASPLDGPAGEFDADADGDIDIGELGNAGTAFAQGELTIAELGAVGQEFAS